MLKIHVQENKSTKEFVHNAMCVYRISDDYFRYLHFMTEPAPNSQQNALAHLYSMHLYFYVFCISA